MSKIPAGYRIGRPRPDELAELPAIEVEAAAIFPPEDIAPGMHEQGLPLSFFEAVASEGRLWVARKVEPASLVGFAAVILLDGSAHLQEMQEMDVLPAHGHRGLGRALLLHVAQSVRASGFAYLTLTTFRHLAWNGPFYSSAGFAEIPARELGPDLRAALAEEAEQGLDPNQRVAMRLDLHTVQGHQVK